MKDEPQYRPEDFFDFLATLPNGDGAILCGGQAVNLLANLFLPEEQIEGILGQTGSLTSSDMDLMVSDSLRKDIFSTGTRSKNFTINKFADCRQPIDFVIVPDDGSDLMDSRIDVLRSVKGVHVEKDRVFEDALELEGIPCRLMNPVTLLIAKAENCATLEQDSKTEKRNDVDHLRLLIPIVRNYFRELIVNCSPDSKEDQRDIIRFLKKINTALKKTNFKKGLRLAEVDINDSIPIRQINDSELETLRKYLNQTFLKNLEA